MRLYKSKDEKGLQKSECLFISDGNFVFKAIKEDDESYQPGNCELIIEGSKVYRPKNPTSKEKGSCINIIKGNKVYFSDDDKGEKLGEIHFIIESNNIYGAESDYNVKSRLQYVIEDNKIFRMNLNRYGEEEKKCILIAEDLLYRQVILAVLTNFFV
ncbi:MAG: hypothetical protein EA412_14840 [Chitinophagaceae bacterium]|nr:MAG: hypothetical protein EA412_14840 [Chitinophagaceae bacterium]